MEINEPAVKYGKSLSGITREDLNQFLKKIGMTFNEFSKILPVNKRTIEKVPKGETLSTIASDRIIQLISLFDFGTEVFGDLEAFKEWLYASNLSLGDKKPFEYLNTSTGIGLVSDTLGRVSFGVYA